MVGTVDIIETCFFLRLRRFFLRGTLKMSPAVSMKLFGQFSDELTVLIVSSCILVGLPDFAGSKFQQMVNWPSFDQKKIGTW